MIKVSSAIALAFLALLAYSVYHAGHNNPFQTAGEFTQWLATEAVRDARDNNRRSLDYTPESIQNVETILGCLHDQYLKNPSSISVNGLGSAYGAYIGEVIRRSESGARWERDDPIAGEKSYPFHWAGRVSFPMSWCQKRIINGPEDNVWLKYRLLKAGEAKSAARVVN